MKYKGDDEIDWDKFTAEYDESLIRMKSDLESLDCSEAEKSKLVRRLQKLLQQRGLT